MGGGGALKILRGKSVQIYWQGGTRSKIADFVTLIYGNPFKRGDIIGKPYIFHVVQQKVHNEDSTLMKKKLQIHTMSSFITIMKLLSNLVKLKLFNQSSNLL